MNTSQKVASIISYLANTKDHRGIAEISRELRLNKSSVHRLLTSLRDVQWVRQDSTSGKYALGNAMLEISASIISNMDIRTIGLPYLEKLRSVTSETATLVLRIDLETMVLEQLPGLHEILRMTPVGKRLPLWLGSEGRSILASLQVDEIEQVLDDVNKQGNLVSASGKHIDVSKLHTEIIEIRKKGYAVSSGERVLGGSGVAAPIFNKYRQVVGCISATGPLPRFTYETANKYGALVKELADGISRCLGETGYGSILP
jgi:DNA-binding IclR family transcriptional regulator